MAESGEMRTSVVQKAKMLELVERYEDMAKLMKDVVETDELLTEEERNLLSVAYKNMVGARRSSWRVMSSMEAKLDDSDSKKKAAGWVREKVEAEMKEMCGDVLSLLDKCLIPKADSPESEVVYQKMKGDYFRYLVEIAENRQEGDEMAEKAEAAYKKAHEKAIELPTTNPVRLELALSFSVFHYEIRNNPGEACRLAKEAIDDACKGLDQLQEGSYKDCMLNIQLLRDNLTLWTSDTEHDQGEGDEELSHITFR